MARIETQPFSVAEVVHLEPNVVRIVRVVKAQNETEGHPAKKSDPPQIDIRSKPSQDFLHTGLAPSFRNTQKGSTKEMDDELKVIIAAVNRQLEALAPDMRTWEEILSIFLQNPLLEPMDTSRFGVDRADKLIKEGRNFFHVAQGHNDYVVDEVLHWFTNIVGDQDVFDINVLVDIVATTGAAIDSFPTFFVKFEHHEKTVVDIGVVRYPEIDNPYFKVHRIQLFAWRDCRRIVFRGKDTNGIAGEYNMRCFKPRDSVINVIKAGLKQKAIAEAESLFAQTYSIETTDDE